MEQLTQGSDPAVFARHYLDTLCDVLRRLPTGDIVRVIEILEAAFVEGRHVFLIGNGGSAATASHMANDLSKTVSGGDLTQPGFRAIALTDNVPLLAAWANDVNFAEVFVGQLRSLAQAGDVLVALSGSGTSANLVRAVEWGRENGLTTVGLLGRDGGVLRQLVDAAVVVPAQAYGPIEDTHLILNHLLTSYFQQRIGRLREEALGGRPDGRAA